MDSENSKSRMIFAKVRGFGVGCEREGLSQWGVREKGLSHWSLMAEPYVP